MPIRTFSQKHKMSRRSRGRPRLEDIAAIEKRLLAVALKEFLQHGYGGTSMLRIVKAAEISKTTLYARFPSKENLFRAIMRRQIERLDISTSLFPHGKLPDLKRGLISYANRALDMSFEGDLLEVNRLIYSEAQRFPELGAAAAERAQIGIDQVAAFIRKCAAAGGAPCKNPQYAAEAFMFMLRGWYVNIMLTGRKVSQLQREKWVEHTVHILLSDWSKW